jgi:hypothetical protein
LFAGALINRIAIYVINIIQRRAETCATKADIATKGEDIRSEKAAMLVIKRAVSLERHTSKISKVTPHLLTVSTFSFIVIIIVEFNYRKLKMSLVQTTLTTLYRTPI